MFQADIKSSYVSELYTKQVHWESGVSGPSKTMRRKE